MYWQLHHLMKNDHGLLRYRWSLRLQDWRALWCKFSVRFSDVRNSLLRTSENRTGSRNIKYTEWIELSRLDSICNCWNVLCCEDFAKTLDESKNEFWDTLRLTRLAVLVATIRVQTPERPDLSREIESHTLKIAMKTLYREMSTNVASEKSWRQRSSCKSA